MSPEAEAPLAAVVTVSLSAAVAFGLYKLIAPRGRATSAGAHGRKWMAWMISIGTITLLPKFFRETDADSFATWMICVVFYGGFAFVIGWVIGPFTIRRQGGEVLSQPLAPSQPPFPQSPVPAESCGSLATPPTIVASMESRLAHLKALFDKGLISKDDYDQKKQEILTAL